VHHGGLQRFVNFVELAIQAASLEYPILRFVDARFLLFLWSPGTFDLLDYNDNGIGLDNPDLLYLNTQEWCSAPQRGLQLIAGSDSLPPLGFLVVGESPNDAVVPARSAHAQTLTGLTVPVLRGSVLNPAPTEFYNHLHVGTPSQSISLFAQRDILPVLSDWVVSTVTAFTVNNPTNVPGSVNASIQVDYNVPHGDITGVVPVLYFKNGNGEWHIAFGADDVTHNPTAAVDISKNSKALATPLTVRAQAAIPVPNPQDPTTLVLDMRLALISLGPNFPTVPADPTALQFGLP